MEVTIDPATDEVVRSGCVGRQLRECNRGHIGEYPAVRTLRPNARDAGNQVMGGLRAIVAMHWLRVEMLWIGAAIRGHAIGSRLLMAAERMALGMGANDAALATFEWQAPGCCVAILRKSLCGIAGQSSEPPAALSEATR